jgi:hypothetical protein
MTSSTDNKPSSPLAIIVFLALLLGIGLVVFLMRSGPTPPGGPAPAPVSATPAPVARPAAMPDDTPVVFPAEMVVYQHSFLTPPGPEWQPARIARTLKGERPYLGGFYPHEHPTLSLMNLPPHRLVRFTFDLYLMGSWDGSSPVWGPGLLDVNVGDGRSLIHSTFCNCGFFIDNNEQSFPDTFPAKPFPAWTLAVENRSLGNMQSWGGPERTFDASGVYHLVLTFPHSEPSIEFLFQSTLPDNPNKPYGLANVQVETLPDLASFTDEEFDALWAKLGGADAAAFFEARWKLISAGDAAVAYIAAHLPPIPRGPLPDPVKSGRILLPFPTSPDEILLQRARQVLDTIHTPAALDLKARIRPFNPDQP